MKKQRALPFGYGMRSGRIEINEQEAAIVHSIYRMYQEGGSLESIATELQNQEIPYSERNTGWDKHKIRRILEDARYTGTDKFTAIIGEEQFDAMRQLYTARTARWQTTAENPEKYIWKRLHCMNCGGKIKRIGGRTKERSEMQALAKNVRVIPANPLLTPTGRPRTARERVAAYCRVSTDEEDQLNSFAVQKEYYEQKISETPEWSNAGIFADEGISGTGMERRTEFLKMIRACRQGKIDRILCKSISRFARNTVDCLDTVRELKEMGIAVFFEKENIDTLKQQSEFIITLYSGFAQAESESISANVRMGKRMGFAQGKVVFRTDMMIGYTKDADGKPTIDPAGAATVLRIYASYLAGMSLGQIKNELIADNIPTAKGVRAWSSETIKSILTNERYMGDALLQKWYKAGCLAKGCKKNNGELPQYYVENNHEGIVSRELFNRVQSEMARRANRKKAATLGEDRTKGKYSARYALTERLVCGECGTPYRRCTWTQKGEKRIVWRCISRLEHGKQYCRNSPTMDEYKIHTAIVEAFNMVLENREEILETVTEAIRTAFENGRGKTDMPALRQRRADLKLVMDSLIDRILQGNENCAELDGQLKESMDELEKVEEAIRQQDRERMAAENENARLNAVLAAIQETPCALTEYDDVLVRQTIDRVTVDSKEQITVCFGYGVEVQVRVP